MARFRDFRNSLSGGEIAQEYLMRTDADVRRQAASRALNVQLLTGGGWRRRWGTRHMQALTGPARLEKIGVGLSDARLLLFMPGKLRILTTDGTLVQELTGAPWTAETLWTMQVAIEDFRVIVTSRSFWPHAIVFEANTWVMGSLSFAPGLNGTVLQPYWRFATRGITMAVSGYAGAVTVTMSEAVFTSAHVGTRFRYTGTEILITAFTSSTVVTGTVIGRLFPSVRVSLADTDGFLIGQVVQGQDSQVRGVITAITAGSPGFVTVQLLDGFTSFNWTNSTTNEKIIGPTAKSGQGTTAPTDTATPATTTEWDEQMVSAARGYPGACGLHRSRLLLGDFPQAPNALAASTVGDVTDFDLGDSNDADAVIERVGRESSLGVRHFGSAEQLLVFTEAGPFYVPEQVGAPLSPTNIELLRVGPEIVGQPTPILVSEGMLFIEHNSGRLMATVPTGNVRKSWEIADMSEMAPHLMGEPVEIELYHATSATDRLIHVVKADGTMAVMTYRRAGSFSAWFPWETSGKWLSVVAIDGVLFCVACRTIAGVDRYFLESFDESALADGMVTLPSATTPVAHLANQTVHVWSGQDWIGEFPMNGSGVLQGDFSGYESLSVGFNFPVVVTLTPPIDSERGLSRQYRIACVDLDVVSSGDVLVNGFGPSGFANGGGIGGSIELQTDVRRYRLLGRGRTDAITISQPYGSPLQVRSVTMEVVS